MAAPKVGVLRRLVAFLAPYKRRIAGALVALVVAAGCVLALGQGLKHVVDAGFSSGDPGLLDRALAGVDRGRAASCRRRRGCAST